MLNEHEDGTFNAYDENGRVKVDEPFIDFDYGSADQKGARPDRYTDEDYHLLSARLIEWIHQDGNSKPGGVMIRAYVVCLFLAPQIYNTPTETRLASIAGVSKQSLNRWVVNFRDTFNYRFIGMKSDEARENYSELRREE